MRIALIGDLHGNLPALEAVARDIQGRGADAVYCLGDMTGKGPSSPETLDWALANCAVVLMGNWDDGIADPALSFPDLDWYRAQLGEKRLATLAGGEHVCTTYVPGSGSSAPPGASPGAEADRARRPAPSPGPGSRAGPGGGIRRTPACGAPIRSLPCSRASATCRRPTGTPGPGRPCGLPRASRGRSQNCGASGSPCTSRSRRN